MKRKTDNFSKFFEKKSNGAIKEAFKQEKKAAKKERKDAIERHFEEKRQTKAARFGGEAAAPGSASPTARPPKHGKAAGGAANKQADRAKPPKYPRTGAPKRSAAEPGIPKNGQAPTDRKPVASNQKPSIAAPAARAQLPAPSRGPAKEAAPHTTDLIPLNKYIAHGGICSRRDAAELIRQGKVQVNGRPVTEPGTRVSPSDQVQVNGKKITMSRNFAYILLNKPKDYITTTDDPLGRKTVLDLIRQATPERVYPIGRLDRNTSGVLLLTNDGDLAQKLAHPSHEVKKIYHVTLDKVLTRGDFEKIAEGVTLEDGLATVDVIAYADAKDKSQVGLEIHSGRNRIVRRIFEHLGYDVRGLDRVMYAGLTKKNVQRGKWRLLTEKEIRILKYLNSSIRTVAPVKEPAPVKSGPPAKPVVAAKSASPASGKEFDKPRARTGPQAKGSYRKRPSAAKGHSFQKDHSTGKDHSGRKDHSRNSD